MHDQRGVEHREWITEDRHTLAVEALLPAARKKLSIVDCASFQTMRQFAIRTAFSPDAHFAEQGFEMIPRKRR